MKVFGDVTELTSELQALVAKTEEISERYEGFQANICLNYGGRDEIVRAAERYAKDYAEGRAHGELTEEQFSDLPLLRRYPRSRSTHPPRRRAADIELPSVAVRIFGVLLHRRTAGRTSRRMNWTRPSPPSGTATGATVG